MSTMTPEPFYLRHIVQDVLNHTDLTSPDEIAEEVLSRIPRHRRAEAFRQSLRQFVRQVTSEVRNTAPVTPAPINDSVKVAAIREGWQRRLHDRVHVGRGIHKLLRDCTYDDLLFCAAERQEIAERNHARARQFNAWARLLTQYNVETFGELPIEQQMAALGRVA